MLTEQQIRQTFLGTEPIPIRELMELCMNPNSGITLEMLRKVGYPRINQLEELCREHLLEDIKNTPSNYSREKMYEIISNNILSRDELVDNYNILTDRAYYHIMRYPHLEDEQRELPISHIEKPCSEPGNIDVYFFGVSGSGKTCLLAGLLSLSGQLGFQVDPRGPGGGGPYAIELRNYVRTSMLPPRTDQSFIQVIDAQVNDRGLNLTKISFIEMSGIKIAEFAVMDNPLHLEDLGPGAADLLINDNKKILFFVIDPTNEKNVKTNEGNILYIKQSDVIVKVLNLLSKHKSLMEMVEAIHIIITKSDTLGECFDGNTIRELLIAQGYMAPLSRIKRICETYNINNSIGFHAGIYPFSIGKFLPGDVYTFDEMDSLKILRSTPVQSCVYGPPFPNSFFSKLAQWFNK